MSTPTDPKTAKPTRANPQRGEVWRARLDPVQGSEQAKTRPVVVMSTPGVGRATMRVCVPITGRLPVHSGMTWCIPLKPTPESGLSKDSTADAAQVRALDVTRFDVRLGALDPDDVGEVAAAVALCVQHAPAPRSKPPATPQAATPSTPDE